MVVVLGEGPEVNFPAEAVKVSVGIVTDDGAVVSAKPGGCVGLAAVCEGMGIDSTPGPGVFLTQLLLAELNPDKMELVASLLALSEADESSEVKRRVS